MKMNNKGFMLAEVVVVSVVIAMILVTSFTGLNKVSSGFNTRNKYFDIDSEYLAIEVNNFLIKNGNINNLIENNTSKKIDISSITTVYSGYDSINAYFSLYSDDKISSLSDKQTFNDYITYFRGHFDFNEEYTYVIITEMCKTADDCSYYGLRVR